MRRRNGAAVERFELHRLVRPGIEHGKIERADRRLDLGRRARHRGAIGDIDGNGDDPARRSLGGEPLELRAAPRARRDAVARARQAQRQRAADAAARAGDPDFAAHGAAKQRTQT